MSVRDVEDAVAEILGGLFGLLLAGLGCMAQIGLLLLGLAVFSAMVKACL